MTNYVTDQILKSFDVSCAMCGSDNVIIEFSAGYVHDCGGDTGSLTIECKVCRKQVSVSEG